MKINFGRSFFLIIIVGLMIGCRPENVYKELVQLEDNKWAYSKPVSFEPVIDDTVGFYDVSLYLDHLKSYPFQNLYVLFSHGETGNLITDTIAIDLIEKEGYFKGNCNQETCRLETILLPRIRFDNPGKQQFTIEQFTRKDSLEGIREIGLVITKGTME